MNHAAEPDIPAAPADRFSTYSAQLAQLNARLAELRQSVPLLPRMSAGALHGVICACAATLAYLPAHPLGLREGYWAAMTAIYVVQTEFHATENTARQQFIGAAIGGAVAVCTSLSSGPNLLIYAAAIFISIFICWALKVASACHVAGVTATIVLLVPHTSSAERMYLSRLCEVAWGVCVAVTVVWLAARLPARNRSHGL